MAKKINFSTIDEVQRALNALKDLHIEHVHVKYPGDPKKDKPEKQYLVVLVRNLADAKSAFEMAGLKPKRIKNSRHYEMTALTHIHYQPQFDCKCRHCGKIFKSTVKEAVWCSKECHKAFRDAKRASKQSTV